MELTIKRKSKVKRDRPVIISNEPLAEPEGRTGEETLALQDSIFGERIAIEPPANENTPITLPEENVNELQGNDEAASIPTFILPFNTQENEEQKVSTSSPFIQANTVDATLEEIKEQHIIPVFIKDNEHVISHAEFIETAMDVVSEIYSSEKVLLPAVRLSHPIKGRIPEARNKLAALLAEHEKTLYYERMAFVIEIPSVYDEIEGNMLSLVIGGVKAYNLDNLYAKKGGDEHFKIFIGFKNTVCTNLCVWTDGFMGNVKVSTVGQLKACIRTLVDNYNAHYQILQMQKLSQHSLTEKQFATFIGKCRMYQHLPPNTKNKIIPLLLGDSQLNTICRDYYKDESFCRGADGNINLWKLYNLLTGANKSSYIDNFLDRSVSAYHFAEALRLAMEGKATSWYLT